MEWKSQYINTRTLRVAQEVLNFSPLEAAAIYKIQRRPEEERRLLTALGWLMRCWEVSKMTGKLAARDRNVAISKNDVIQNIPHVPQ